MNKTVVIDLNGHADQFRLEGEAYDLLSQYLDRAAARLPTDADRAEVLGDLERSVGDKLVALLGSEDRAVTAADIAGILDEIGAIDGEGASEQATSGGLIPVRLRRLHRIRAGQQFAGVCTGLAASADLNVGWVRFGFMVATAMTLGLAAIVYIALAFVLPISDTGDAPVPPRNRRLERIKAGQQIAGVCNGLAEYAEIKVSAVRAVFVFATLLTVGGFALVYGALALMLPIRSARSAPAR